MTARRPRRRLTYRGPLWTARIIPDFPFGSPFRVEMIPTKWLKRPRGGIVGKGYGFRTYKAAAKFAAVATATDA